jgi:small subunit ribosomal protein S1
MSNPNTPASQPASEMSLETNESFGDLLSQYEKSHARTNEEGPRQVNGTVVAVKEGQVFFDIGYKIEGVLPLTAFKDPEEAVKLGKTFPVTVKGRNEEGYYDLSLLKIAQPKDWSSLERAFTDKETI